jgi:opacity protein-like surface antigen
MRARLASVAIALLAPALALAQYDPRYYPPAAPRSPAEQGLVLGGRVGYGAPFGDISGNDPALGDLMDSKIPIGLELGYRFNRTVWGMLYLELAPAFVNDSFCPSGANCRAADFRFGVEAQFHLAPYQPVDPWVGVGVGLEVLSARTNIVFPNGTTALADASYLGLEFPLLEGGLDFNVAPQLAIGPFVSLGLGTYTSFSYDPKDGSGTTTHSITDKTLHGWLEVGVKGTFKL